MSLQQWFYKLSMSYRILRQILVPHYTSSRTTKHLFSQMKIMGVDSLAIVLLTSSFISMIFTFQVARELMYLNASNLVGSILTVIFIRELSPVLTAIIVTSRIGSAFTAEIASMKVTEQIDVLYMLNVDPLQYLVNPRVHSCLLMLPLLTIIGFATSISSGIFVSAILYNISPFTFLNASYLSVSILDLIYAMIKAFTFGLIIGVNSCTWGLTSAGGSVNVGRSTTSSVVTSLLVIFISDFFLSFVMYRNFNSLLS
uniref:hypothetical protein ycf63 n=1 Tax=Nemalion vermiculare TaxID=935621 RepID=UPI00257C021D|nr:hypothetical protein ycf63 [Nemalion vermiculare]WGV34364.1 hypothetical protein ycf63 [Nemalion vermiculare]